MSSTCHHARSPCLSDSTPDVPRGAARRVKMFKEIRARSVVAVVFSITEEGSKRWAGGERDFPGDALSQTNAALRGTSGAARCLGVSWQGKTLHFKTEAT